MYINVGKFCLYELEVFNLYPANALNPFKSASYGCTNIVRCSHLNAPYTRVEA